MICNENVFVFFQRHPSNFHIDAVSFRQTFFEMAEQSTERFQAPSRQPLAFQVVPTRQLALLAAMADEKSN